MEPLPGGFVNEVLRVGDTVRRHRAPEFVHRLLAFFEQHGWPGAPRLLGIDDEGREILTFVEGHVAWRSPTAGVDSDASLVRVAELVREFHDLTAGTPLAGDQEVACHNDLSPKNTVYRGDPPRPVVFLDWDIAAPGARIHDLAHVCWQYLDLGPSITDLPATARRLRLMCDTYGEPDHAAAAVRDAHNWVVTYRKSLR